MSNKYKHGDRVPTKVLAYRLDELAKDVTKADLSQFVMRIPAELDRCPDLVMSQSAERLRALELAVAQCQDGIAEGVDVGVISVWLQEALAN